MGKSKTTYFDAEERDFLRARVKCIRLMDHLKKYAEQEGEHGHEL